MPAPPPGARVLVAVFGSAGDLFPLVPTILRLRDEGHDVRCALSRASGLYTRAWGVPTYPVGSGQELRVVDDDRVITNRFAGWASIRRLVDRCVVPTLGRDVELLRRLFAEWRPDVVVAATFAPAARIAAHRERIACVDVSVYPHHRGRLARSRSFGSALRRAVADLAGDSTDELDESVVTALAWGVGTDAVVLHDRALLGDLGGAGESVGEVVGFPHWDEGRRSPGDEQLLDEWLARSRAPVVAVTFGSFPGVRQQQAWADAAAAAEARGVRAVFVGPHRRGDRATGHRGEADVLTVGYVPFSRFASRVDAVVHHGGVGTTFGVLRAGRPSVVVPQAFDHSFNAALVARAGAGLAATGATLAGALDEVLGEPRYTTTAQALARRLVPGETATDRVVERIVRRTTPPGGGGSAREPVGAGG